MHNTSKRAPPDLSTSRLLVRGAVVALLAVGAIVAYWQFGYRVPVRALVDEEQQLRALQRDSPLAVAGTAVLLYVLVAAVIPGAMFLTLAYGWFFGFWQGLVIVSFGSTAGATLAFLASRALLRDMLPRFLEGRVGQIRREFDEDGPYYLFTLRLLPAVPFFVVNLGMGLTRIRTWTFWWVSQLGMLPGTAAYVYAGSSLPSAQKLVETGVEGLVSWRLLAALAVIGFLPLALKKLWDAFR